MSEYLTPEEVEEQAYNIEWDKDLGEVKRIDLAHTLREYAAIVDAVAVDSAPIEVFVTSVGMMMQCESCLCVWYEGEPQSHAAGCIGIRARKVRGYE
jgi:hypothetical protein